MAPQANADRVPVSVVANNHAAWRSLTAHQGRYLRIMADEHVYRVTYEGALWCLKRGEAEMARFPTQQLAAEAAKAMARSNRGVAIWCNDRGSELGRVDARPRSQQATPEGGARRSRLGRRHKDAQVH